MEEKQDLLRPRLFGRIHDCGYYLKPRCLLISGQPLRPSAA